MQQNLKKIKGEIQGENKGDKNAENIKFFLFNFFSENIYDLVNLLVVYLVGTSNSK